MTDQTGFLLQIGAGIAAGLLVHLLAPGLRRDLPAATLFAGCIATAIVGMIALIVVGMTWTLAIGLLYSFAIGAACAFPVLLLRRLVRGRT